MRIKPLAYALGILSLLFALAAGCGSQGSAPASGTTSGAATEAATTSTPTSGGLKELKIEDVKQGKGDAAAPGDELWVLYTGKLADGTVFDSSAKQDNKPFAVTIGTGQVIKGWEQGLVGLKVGGERKLSIPYTLAYGENGRSPIPPKADLFFDMKAVAMIKKGEERTVQVTNIKKGTGPEATVGDKVTISYIGTLPTGEEFDNTAHYKKPYTFRLGKGETQVAGLDMGIRGMQVGGERKIEVPPMLGMYMGTDKIPTNSILIFDVKLLKIG